MSEILTALSVMAGLAAIFGLIFWRGLVFGLSVALVAFLAYIAWRETWQTSLTVAAAIALCFAFMVGLMAAGARWGHRL